MGKPCAYVGQDLADHLRNTLFISMIFINENNWINMAYHRIKSIKSKLPNLEFSKYDILNIIKLECMLHDIGKASKIYQDQFDDDCNKLTDKISFRLHEVPSSYIAYNLLRPIYGDILAKLSSLAILLHIVRSENPLMYRLNVLRKYGVWDLSSYQEFLSNLLGFELNTSLVKIKYDEAYRHIQMLRSFVETYPDISKLHVLFLTPVMVGDYLDASDRVDEGGRNLWRLMFVNQLKEAMGMDHD